MTSQPIHGTSMRTGHSCGLVEKVSGYRCRWIFVLEAMALLLTVVPLRAQDPLTQNSAQGTNNPQQGSAPNDEELAKDVKNPFADLIQVQIGNDFGFGGDTGNRLQYAMTLQPIIPIKINDSWDQLPGRILV